MYLTIRKYSGVTSVDEAVGRVEVGLLPYLRTTAGFVAYYAVKYEDGDIGSVTVYDTQANAEASGAGAMDWVRLNMHDLLPNEPTVYRGEVALHEFAKAAATSA